jgi:hypothetical protein
MNKEREREMQNAFGLENRMKMLFKNLVDNFTYKWMLHRCKLHDEKRYISY